MLMTWLYQSYEASSQPLAQGSNKEWQKISGKFMTPTCQLITHRRLWHGISVLWCIISDYSSGFKSTINTNNSWTGHDTYMSVYVTYVLIAWLCQSYGTSSQTLAQGSNKESPQRIPG